MAGSPSYDFLGESLLFDETMLAESFRTVTDADLERELARYREFIDSCPVTVSESPGRILAGMGSPDLQLLAQCAWYMPEFVVRDPLYELTSRKTNAQIPIEQYLGLEQQTSDERRKDICTALAVMKKLVPMVAAGYVNILPISRAFEPPSELPLTAPKNGGADLLPAPLMNWFNARAVIRPVEIRDGKMLLLQQDARDAPRRSIAVEFRKEPRKLGAEWEGEDGPGGVFLYNLFEQRVVSIDERTRIAKFVMHLPEEAPSPEAYRAWVSQSIHQSAAAFADRTIREVRLADALHARFLTRSSLAAAFLSLSTPQIDAGNIMTTTLNAVVNFDVPFLEGIAIDDLMRVRQEEGEAFEAFRNSLEKELRSLELEVDPDVAKIKAEHVRHELATVQLAAIETQIKSFKTKLFADSALAIGSLLASVPTGGLSLIGTGIAAASLMKAKAEYEASVKQHPAYFLWRVRKVGGA